MPQYAPRPQTGNAIQSQNIQDGSHVDKLGNQLSELDVGSNPAGQDTFDQRTEAHNPLQYEVGLVQCLIYNLVVIFIYFLKISATRTAPAETCTSYSPRS